MTEPTASLVATPTGPVLAGIVGPYPGLRPFNRLETPIFFGRDDHVDQLIEVMGRSRLLGIVGESGCGKSSLVLAGLIPALESGLFQPAGASWRVAVLRPGNTPLRALAESLFEFELLPPGKTRTPHEVELLLASLRRGPLALVELLAGKAAEGRDNVLILVDQFEEIFRFRESGPDPSGVNEQSANPNRDGEPEAACPAPTADDNSQKVDPNEAAAFVAVLLRAARAEAPIYVALTMRSDYLGQCAVFDGLPEALNGGQYLTPRLDQDQRRQAIEGPARVFGGRVDRALTTRVLNDMDAAPDALPLMQHALMRVWQVAQERGGDAPIELTSKDYDAVGGLAHALSRHVNEAYDALDEGQRLIAEALFRALTERATGRRDTRRPGQARHLAREPDPPMGPPGRLDRPGRPAPQGLGRAGGGIGRLLPLPAARG
jgi:hypothetical protein